MTHSFIKPDCDAEQGKQPLCTITLLKSSNQEFQKIYAEAYLNACNAVKLDTLANYTKARDAYKKVIQVFIRSLITCVQPN
jgi:hypothetical protein